MSSARRRRTTTTSALVATAVATAATVGALALTGTPTGGTGGTAESQRSDLEGLLTPVAAAAELPAFTGCEELRRWYVRAALPRVGPWGFQTLYGGPRAEQAFADAATAADRAVGGSDTGTNVQEEGVDEPDLAKTDGAILVRIADRDLVVVDVSGERKRTLSRTRLPGAWHQGRELLLVGDTVLVVGTDDAYGWEPVDAVSRVVPGQSGATRTHLMRVDVSDPRYPRVAGHQRVDGELVGAREYGDGTVRVVVGTGLPDLDFVHPTKDRTPREARRANRAVVRAAPVEDWLPGIRQGDGRGRHPLLGCGDVRHPEQDAGAGTLIVLTLDVDDPQALVATAITAAGDLTYSSTGRLYVATVDSAWWDVVPVEEGALPGRGPAPSTQVHAFALDGGVTTYVASGTVPGTVRDRWSFSEHDGRLRVATALGRGWQPRENAVHVLEESGDTLRVVGRVDGLGPGEQIRSVRWLGDLAVVVTFRQTDPLYTLDLSDPAAPRVLGELKIRGYSGYLHPAGHGLLLGLGQDATARGRSLGGQAAVFDLADTGAVRRTGTVGFPASAHLATEWEPRAFTYLPGQRTALVPVEDWRRERVRLVALRVGEHGGLSVARSWPLRHWGASTVRALPLPDGRLALVHRGVRVVDIG